MIVRTASTIQLGGGKNQADNDNFKILANGKAQVHTNDEVSKAAADFVAHIDTPNVSSEILKEPLAKIVDACKKLI
jgi:hypothetical protein